MSGGASEGWAIAGARPACLFGGIDVLCTDNEPSLRAWYLFRAIGISTCYLLASLASFAAETSIVFPTAGRGERGLSTEIETRAVSYPGTKSIGQALSVKNCYSNGREGK